MTDPVRFAPHEKPEIGVEKNTERACGSHHMMRQARLATARVSAVKTQSGCAGNSRSLARLPIRTPSPAEGAMCQEDACGVSGDVVR